METQQGAVVLPEPPLRTPARTGAEAPGTGEVEVSIRLKRLGESLKNSEFRNNSNYESLYHSLEGASFMLGATPEGQKEVMKLVKASVSEIKEAEGKHLKLIEGVDEALHGGKVVREGFGSFWGNLVSAPWPASYELLVADDVAAH